MYIPLELSLSLVWCSLLIFDSALTVLATTTYLKTMKANRLQANNTNRWRSTRNITANQHLATRKISANPCPATTIGTNTEIPRVAQEMSQNRINTERKMINIVIVIIIQDHQMITER